MTTVVLGFPNVESFTILRDDRSHPRTLPLLLSTWGTFGSNVRHLAIESCSADFKALLHSVSSMVSLEVLTLYLGGSAAQLAVDTNTQIEAALNFLREVSPKLRGLHINFLSLEHGAWQLFRSLGRMPNLATFSLYIGGFFPSVFLTSSILMKFLNQNAETLRHVRLPPHKCSHARDSADSDQPSAEELLLSNLQTLEILRQISELKSESLKTARTYIQRSKDTLTSFYLKGHFLSLKELGNLIQPFSDRPADSGLKTLQLEVTSLSPQFFDVLAEKLVGLDRLDINFLDLVSNDKGYLSSQSMEAAHREYWRLRDIPKEVRYAREVSRRP